MTLNIVNSEKQRTHLSSEIEKYEEAVSQFKSSVEKTQQQYKDCHAELKASQQQVKLFDFNVFWYSYFFLNYCLFKKDSRTQNSNINK